MNSLTKFTFALLFISQTIFAQHYRELDSLASSIIDNYNVKGLAIVAVKDGKTVYKKGFGDANEAYKMDENTPLYIASNTKAFVGLAMLKLINQNKISLNDKMLKYIDRSYFPEEIEVDSITIKNLLSHTTGLSNDPITFRTSSSGEYPENLQELLKFTVYRSENTTLETSFSYSNLGYLLCGIIIENVSGLDWKTYLENEVLSPLSLVNTKPYMPKADLKAKMALPYIFTEEKPLKLVKKDNTLHAAGGLFTNLKDMGQWLSILTTNDTNYINSEGSEFNGYLTRLTEANDSFGPIKIDGYGYGWYFGNILGMPINFHAGGFSGHNSLISFLADKNLGIFIFMNENSNLRLAALQLTFLYYYLETADPNLEKTFPIFEKRVQSVFENQKPQNLTPIDNTSIELPTASFFNEKYGTLTIEKKGNNYLVKLGNNLESFAYIDGEKGSFKVQFIPESDVHFKIEGEGENIKIKYGEDYGYFYLKN